MLPFQIAGDVAVVQCFDVEALGVAGPIAQLVGLEYALSRQRRLSHGAVAEPDERMGHRKIGIDRDRTLEERQGLCRSPLHDHFPSGAVGLQRFKRRRRRFLERRRVFLDGGERFANSRSETRRNLTECAQDIFFPCRLRLLVGEDVAGRAVLRAQAEDVLTAERSRSILRARRRWPSGRTRPAQCRESIAHPPAGSSAAAFFRMRSSEIRLRNGDCWSCTASPCRSVSSNTGSPVVLVNSASTIVSLSVSGAGRRL